MSSMTRDPANHSSTTEESVDEERELDLLEAQHLLELASIERTQSRYDQALRCLQDSLQIFRKYNVPAGVGMALGNIGSVYREQGLFSQATEVLNEGLDLIREAGDKRGEGALLGIFGNIYRAKGDHERALRLFQEALDISRLIGNVHTEGINLGNLGCVYQAQGEYELAKDMHSQALAISQKYGDAANEGINHGNIGDALFGMKRLEEAEKSFRLAIKMGDDSSVMFSGVFRGSLALLLATQGRLGEAHILLNEGKDQVTPYAEEHAKYLVKKGQIRLIGGDIKGARSSLKHAQSLAEELKVQDESEVGLAIQHLVDLLNGGQY